MLIHEISENLELSCAGIWVQTNSQGPSSYLPFSIARVLLCCPLWISLITDWRVTFPSGAHQTLVRLKNCKFSLFVYAGMLFGMLNHVSWKSFCFQQFVSFNAYFLEISNKCLFLCWKCAKLNAQVLGPEWHYRDLECHPSVSIALTSR